MRLSQTSVRRAIEPIADLEQHHARDVERVTLEVCGQAVPHGDAVALDDRLDNLVLQRGEL